MAKKFIKTPFICLVQNPLTSPMWENVLWMYLLWWHTMFRAGWCEMAVTCQAVNLDDAWGPARDHFAVDTYVNRTVTESELYTVYRAVVCPFFNRYRAATFSSTSC